MISLLDSAQAVFFDFDGVIADSVGVKTQAFAALYADHPAIVPAVLAYHEAHGGISRLKKFEHYERVLLGREPTPARMTDLAQRFASAVEEAVIASPEIPGAADTLIALNQRGAPCYVVSGTPEDELQRIVARRGLAHFFRAVRGSPAEKADILRELVRAHGHDVAHCLMVGDAMTDYDAARQVGMAFLGVCASPGRAPFGRAVPIIRDFRTDQAACSA